MTTSKMAEIVSNIKYKNWQLLLKLDPYRSGAPYIQWSFNGPCAKTEDEVEWTSRKWYLSGYMTESEVVLTAFKAALTAEEHECRESFSYEGQRIFNPHTSVRALMQACLVEDVRTSPFGE